MSDAGLVFCRCVRPAILQTEHRQIIELFRRADEHVDSLTDIAKNILGYNAFLLVQRLQHAVHTEELIVAVGSFRDAVCVEEELGTRVQLYLILSV